MLIVLETVRQFQISEWFFSLVGRTTDVDVLRSIVKSGQIEVDDIGLIIHGDENCDSHTSHSGSPISYLSPMTLGVLKTTVSTSVMA